MLTKLLLWSYIAHKAIARNTTVDSSVLTSSSTPAAAQTTVNLLIGNNRGQAFVGSVINADCDETTFAVACTSGSFELGSGITQTCDPSEEGRLTYGANTQEYSTRIGVYDVVGDYAETCSRVGTTEAVCSVTVSITGPGTSTVSKTVATLSGDDLFYHQVPITAGVGKLASCTSSGDDSSPTPGNNDGAAASSSAAGSDTVASQTGNVAAATGISEVYRILIAPGAAALLAGVLL